MKLFMLLASAFALLSSSFASAATVEHTFNVQNKTINRLCNERVIVTVNGDFPGPNINVREGDTVIVHVVNKSPYNITIHWHGVFQLMSAWADGVEYITQCAIRPGNNYTYKFKVTQQEGTVWWHAHASVLRATVHGAFIIHPRSGDWYDGNIEDIYRQELAIGGKVPPNAFLINGFPETTKLNVRQGKTYLLRMVNAGLNSNLFFKIAHHKFTVVAVDGAYTEPYITDIIVLGAGQSADVLFTADQPIGSYYMATSAYVVGEPDEFLNNSTARGIIVYDGHHKTTTSPPLMPMLPPLHDTPTAHKFFNNINSLVGAPHWVPVPLEVDEHMFITININLKKCPLNATCRGPLNQKFSASMNNESFVLPVGKGFSIIEAFYHNVSGVYTTDFPDEPPKVFNFTNPKIFLDANVTFAPKSTKVKKLKFNSTVEVVYQNTAILNAQSHPMHLHGLNFHVLAQGFGIFDPIRDKLKYNLVNPQVRNTVGVPPGGWAVIRFQANNPGAWFVHCHVDDHNLWGLDTVFLVENGPTPSTSLPPPPTDLPKC
ncbi:Multicopper oxidase, type 1 [Sesbania bispinosa]|nr:Multicopper oxidase, type 1 [Sesbania bispinosa]